MNTKYNIGDKVKIKSNLECYDTVISSMHDLAGKTMTIIDIDSDGMYMMKEDSHWWEEATIESLVIKANIDLNVNQIVDPPVKCWVRDCDEETYDEDLLFSVDHRKTKRAFATENGMFKQCTLTDPTVSTKKIKKWLTIEDVPVELWGKALVKRKHLDCNHAVIMYPNTVRTMDNELYKDMHYLPLGQPLTGKWLPFESEE